MRREEKVVKIQLVEAAKMRFKKEAEVWGVGEPEKD